MNPKTLLKSNSEHSHQCALFAWARIAFWYGFDIADEWAENDFKLLDAAVSKDTQPLVPALEWIHAIPNGGSRGDSKESRAINGARLKAEGVKSGIPDIFLPWPVAKWHGLYIEMKKPSEKPKREGSKGGLSEKQIKFSNYAERAGYGWAVCYSWKEASEVLKAYIRWK